MTMVTDCWTEPGRGHFPSGYLQVSKVSYGSNRGHRAVFLAVYGYLPEVVMHSCDNPPCFNPAHLVAGTQATNVRDCIDKGRFVGHDNLTKGRGTQREYARS